MAAVIGDSGFPEQETAETIRWGLSRSMLRNARRIYAWVMVWLRKFYESAAPDEGWTQEELRRILSWRANCPTKVFVLHKALRELIRCGELIVHPDRGEYRKRLS